MKFGFSLTPQITLSPARQIADALINAAQNAEQIETNRKEAIAMIRKGLDLL